MGCEPGSTQVFCSCCFELCNQHGFLCVLVWASTWGLSLCSALPSILLMGLTSLTLAPDTGRGWRGREDESTPPGITVLLSVHLQTGLLPGSSVASTHTWPAPTRWVPLFASLGWLCLADGVLSWGALISILKFLSFLCHLRLVPLLKLAFPRTLLSW